jgi:hypothetical protein
MAKTVVACEIIRDELEHAMVDAGGEFQVRWIEGALHNFPDLLRERLQQTLDSLEGSDQVLMAFGRCGNVLEDLRTGGYELILPRADDCISLLLGSAQRRLEYSRDGGNYFLTRGWLRGERNIWAEYLYARKKYGEKGAREIMGVMFKNYRHLSVLDTQSYALDSILPVTRDMADTLKLSHRIIPGTTRYLRDLLTGPWEEERFLRCPPYSLIGELCPDRGSPTTQPSAARS